MWFCTSDIQLCVRGVVCPSVVFQPALLETWVVKNGMNLRNYVQSLSLENARFKLQNFGQVLSHGLKGVANDSLVGASHNVQKQENQTLQTN